MYAALVFLGFLVGSSWTMPVRESTLATELDAQSTQYVVTEDMIITDQPSTTAAVEATTTLQNTEAAVVDVTTTSTPQATEAAAVDATTTSTPQATEAAAVDVTTTSTPQTTEAAAVDVTATSTPQATETAAVDVTTTSTSQATEAAAVDVTTTSTPQATEAVVDATTTSTPQATEAAVEATTTSTEAAAVDVTTTSTPQATDVAVEATTPSTPLATDAAAESTVVPETTTSKAFSCDGKEPDLYPDPEDCTKYYECVRGFADPFHRSCAPGGPVFDPKKKYCDWPENVALPCGVLPVAQDNAVEDAVITFTCDGKAPGVHPDPENCGKFYQCVPGHPAAYQRDCPPGGLVFDVELQVCNWPWAVPAPCGTLPAELRNRH